MSIHPGLLAPRFFVAAALPLAILLSPGLAAAEVTEAEFLAAFDATHPAVVVLEERLGEAEAERGRAGLLENPTLGFEYESSGETVDETLLSLGWRPPLDGRRGLAVDAGDAAVRAARHDLDRARLELRERMRALFAAWATAGRRHELLGRHFESLRELEDRLELRAERGEESLLTARRFTLAVAGVRAELARAEAELARWRGEVAATGAGIDPQSVPLLPALPPVPATVPDDAGPELLAWQSEREAAELRGRLAGRSFEFPELVVGWRRVDDSSEVFDGPYLGLSWDAPLFSRNQGERARAARRFASADARVRLLEGGLAASRESALAAYRTLHSSVAEVRARVDGAPGLVESASASFLAGESTMTDLLETLRSVLESQLAALELHGQALAAHRDLELSAGRPLTEGESR